MILVFQLFKPNRSKRRDMHDYEEASRMSRYRLYEWLNRSAVAGADTNKHANNNRV